MSTSNKEFAYIIGCLTYKLFPDSRFPAPAEDTDWDRLYVLVENHRLSGLFFALGKDSDAWPLGFKHRLRADSYQYSLYGNQCSQRIKTFFETMNSFGVSVIVLKGWAHIQTIYGRDYSQRLCEDVDILIHPKDVDTVEEILLRLNYSHEKESWSGYDRRYHNGTRYFLSNADAAFAGTFSIGLHWGLIHIPSYDPRQIDVDHLFASALPLNVMDVPVLQLAPEDEVVYLCMHVGLHHRYDGALFRYFELASLIVNYGVDLDWQRVSETAVQWQQVLPVRRILRRIDQLWRRIMPPNVLDSFARVRPKFQERFVDFWIRKMREPAAFDHLLMWVTFPRIWERPLIALQDIFPSLEYMRARYGHAPLDFWPLLYVRRFFRALRLLDS